jgi:hypothetical protein
LSSLYFSLSFSFLIVILFLLVVVFSVVVFHSHMIALIRLWDDGASSELMFLDIQDLRIAIDTDRHCGSYGPPQTQDGQSHKPRITIRRHRITELVQL